jgi:phage portal protein BeeE
MGLFDLFRTPRAQARVEPRLVSASDSVQSESQWKGLSVAGGVSRAGVRVSETTVLSIPATLQALRILSGVFAMTPMHYFRRATDGRDRIENEIAGCWTGGRTAISRRSSSASC